jgi:hypothetical protein
MSKFLGWYDDDAINHNPVYMRDDITGQWLDGN